MVATAPLVLMTIPASDLSLSRQVRLIMLDNPSFPIDAVADALELTPDTLRRRLRGEGSSLSMIRENIRRDIATRELTTTGRSVETISARLCYAEARSFTRAFYKWTGLSPSAYRAKYTETR
jgi:AraC-like DNA-binding protein